MGVSLPDHLQTSTPPLTILLRLFKVSPILDDGIKCSKKGLREPRAILEDLRRSGQFYHEW